ncbi:hypothetical protein JCM1840_000414 [Sporobolomyces johnsonii]
MPTPAPQPSASDVSCSSENQQFAESSAPYLSTSSISSTYPGQTQHDFFPSAIPAALSSSSFILSASPAAFDPSISSAPLLGLYTEGFEDGSELLSPSMPAFFAPSSAKKVTLAKPSSAGRASSTSTTVAGVIAPSKGRSGPNAVEIKKNQAEMTASPSSSSTPSATTSPTTSRSTHRPQSPRSHAASRPPPFPSSSIGSTTTVLSPHAQNWSLLKLPSPCPTPGIDATLPPSAASDDDFLPHLPTSALPLPLPPSSTAAALPNAGATTLPATEAPTSTEIALQKECSSLDEPSSPALPSIVVGSPSSSSAVEVSAEAGGADVKDDTAIRPVEQDSREELDEPQAEAAQIEKVAADSSGRDSTSSAHKQEYEVGGQARRIIEPQTGFTSSLHNPLSRPTTVISSPTPPSTSLRNTQQHQPPSPAPFSHSPGSASRSPSHPSSLSPATSSLVSASAGPTTQSLDLISVHELLGKAYRENSRLERRIEDSAKTAESLRREVDYLRLQDQQSEAARSIQVAEAAEVQKTLEEQLGFERESFKLHLQLAQEDREASEAALLKQLEESGEDVEILKKELKRKERLLTISFKEKTDLLGLQKESVVALVEGEIDLEEARRFASSLASELEAVYDDHLAVLDAAQSGFASHKGIQEHQARHIKSLEEHLDRVVNERSSRKAQLVDAATTNITQTHARATQTANKNEVDSVKAQGQLRLQLEVDEPRSAEHATKEPFEEDMSKGERLRRELENARRRTRGSDEMMKAVRARMQRDQLASQNKMAELEAAQVQLKTYIASLVARTQEELELKAVHCSKLETEFTTLTAIGEKHFRDLKHEHQAKDSLIADLRRQLEEAQAQPKPASHFADRFTRKSV